MKKIIDVFKKIILFIAFVIIIIFSVFLGIKLRKKEERKNEDEVIDDFNNIVNRIKDINRRAN